MNISWPKAVYEAILLEADQKTNIFSRKNLIKNQLQNIIKNTQTKGLTPDQTMSHVLQRLRNLGLIKFNNKGIYQLTNRIISGMFITKNKMSQGEKLVKQILDELINEGMEIKYLQEAKHSDLKYKSYLRFDFEIEYKSRKFVIEVDGIQHDKPIEFFGGINNYMLTKYRDSLKDNYCREKDIKMLRIKHDEIIYEIIKNKIKNTIDQNKK